MFDFIASIAMLYDYAIKGFFVFILIVMVGYMFLGEKNKPEE